MSENISRRDFLKISGLGMTAAAVMTGCGPSSRYVVRQAYVDMPEYNQTGVSTYYATTCQECPAGCGLIVRTQEGRAIKVEGNPDHPVNKGRICSRALTSVQGLYNPDRIGGPQNISRGKKPASPLTWEEGVKVVTNSLVNPAKTAFLLGLESDHLYDLVQEVAEASTGLMVYRYGSLATLDGQETLKQACQTLFNSREVPFFDLSNADVVLSFGANFLEHWLSPMAYSRGYRNMRKQEFGKRGYVISFDARQNLTSANADLWIPVRPGTEGLAAQAVGKLAAQLRNSSVPGMYTSTSLSEAANICDVGEDQLHRAAELFAHAERAVALPGGNALASENGLQNAIAILGLNLIAENLGKPGGLFVTGAETMLEPGNDINQLIEKMNSGQIEHLLIHGINPIFELPAALGFANALAKVPNVISFASFEDETAQASDYLIPDHTPLESFGYQRSLSGADRITISAIQPVVQPIHDTKATVDVFLAAIADVGTDLSTKISYTDEVDYLQKKITPLIGASGNISAADLPTFWSKWLQHGGWWNKNPTLEGPGTNEILRSEIAFAPVGETPEKSFHLVVFATQMGDGRGANRPWLQETPDPMTTITWNSWIEINPHTAEELGVTDDDIVTVTASDTGESIEAVVYKYPAIRPDCVAIPFGQGHTALGSFAAGRGCNPATVWSTKVNGAGDFAVAESIVTITQTGKRRPLARQESKAGVYEEH